MFFYCTLPNEGAFTWYSKTAAKIKNEAKYVVDLVLLILSTNRTHLECSSLMFSLVKYDELLSSKTYLNENSSGYVHPALFNCSWN